MSTSVKPARPDKETGEGKMTSGHETTATQKGKRWIWRVCTGERNARCSNSSNIASTPRQHQQYEHGVQHWLLSSLPLSLWLLLAIKSSYSAANTKLLQIDIDDRDDRERDADDNAKQNKYPSHCYYSNSHLNWYYYGNCDFELLLLRPLALLLSLLPLYVCARFPGVYVFYFIILFCMP